MKGKGPGRDLERERAWREVMDRQRQSELSVRGFCRREVVSEASFYAWRRELLRRDRESLSVRRTDREPGAQPAVSRSAIAKRTPADMRRSFDGLVRYSKRLEEGTFRFPTVTSQTQSVQVTAQELSLLLWGIDPSSVKRQKRYVRPASTETRILGRPMTPEAATEGL
jgi:hypothetical protein